MRRHRGAGVLTVEMEAAAAFAVAEHRGVEAGAAFVPSDRVTPDGWAPDFEAAREDLPTLGDLAATTLDAEADVAVSSPAFDGETVPTRYACTDAGGENVSPRVEVGDRPDGTAALALVTDDPHTYRLAVFALDDGTGLEFGADREAVADALDGHVLGAGRTAATFDR